MAKWLFDEHDSSIATLVDADEDGNLVLQHRQDLTPMLDFNQRVRSVIGKGFTRDHDAPRWVARLSGLVLAEALHSGLISIDPNGEKGRVVDQKKFRRFLNDRDYRKFRTSEGKV